MRVLLRLLAPLRKPRPAPGHLPTPVQVRKLERKHQPRHQPRHQRKLPPTRRRLLLPALLPRLQRMRLPLPSQQPTLRLPHLQVPKPPPLHQQALRVRLPQLVKVKPTLKRLPPPWPQHLPMSSLMRKLQRPLQQLRRLKRKRVLPPTRKPRPPR